MTRNTGTTTRAARSAEAGTRRQLDPDALAALEEQRDFLLRSLEDLEREHDAGDVDDVDYEELNDDYTARAAAVMRAIDARNATRADARRPRRWGALVATVGAVVLFGIGAGWLVARSSGEREPGETATGDIRTSTIDELAKASAYTGDATAALQAGDTDAAVAAYQNALASYATVLEQQPSNVEALTYRAWLYHVLALQAPPDLAAGLEADASEGLNRAIEIDPRYPDARIFRAIIHQRGGRLAEARADLDSVDPSRVPAGMSELVEQLESSVHEGG
jgi:tetratricopeptide (TPR) repeat protein